MDQYILYVWVGIMVGSAVVEVIRFRLYAVWFALSALMAALLGLFGLPVWGQVLVFVLVPAAAIPLLRPVVKKRLEAKWKKTEEENRKKELEAEKICSEEKGDIK